MLKRFSAYGFFKNQRYFEPFLILFFIEAGLSFTQIGFLIALREIFLNIAEIPSGAIADLYGRKRSLIFSFFCYIISFIIFAHSYTFPAFTAAMFFFGIGDAFRTGTHKAMIFTWLRINNRTKEKSKVYGYTRSWSKTGSAVSILIAVILLLSGFTYRDIFLFSIIPYVAGIINFTFYPAELDGNKSSGKGITNVLLHLKDSITVSFRDSNLRRLVIEGMSFEGLFKAIKDYVQPLIKQMIILSPGILALTDEQLSIVTIGIVYFFIAVFSATASRQAHRVADFAGDEIKGSKLIWYASMLLYLSLIPLVYLKFYALAVVAFIGLNIAQNIFRPLLISRFDNYADENKGATIMSIESQAKTVATAIFAPIAGYTVDLVKQNASTGDFWPLGVIGFVVTLALIITFPKTKEKTT